MSQRDFPFTSQLLSVIDRFPIDTKWAVTCGSALFLNDVLYDPSDLDFFAPYPDMLLMTPHLADLPVVFPLEWRTSDIFHSYFGRFMLDGIDVDFVGDFSVRRENTLFLWDDSHPCWARLRHVFVADRQIPIFSLEDELLLYLALPDEESKLEKIAAAIRTRDLDLAYLRLLVGRWPVIADRMRGLLGVNF